MDKIDLLRSHLAELDATLLSLEPTVTGPVRALLMVNLAAERIRFLVGWVWGQDRAR